METKMNEYIGHKIIYSTYNENQYEHVDTKKKPHTFSHQKN